ncbi:MAG: lipocalin-like domain-containing protein [Nitrososphaeria archaeon]
MKDNSLIGTWKLKSFEWRASDGSVIYPFGRDVLGYLIFSPEGYFSATLSAANRKKFTSQDLIGGSLEEKAGATELYLSYCGPCEIEKDKFRTRVEISLIPNWVGGYQERYYKIDGKTLSVRSTPMLFGGKEQVAYLIFERV